MNVKFHEIPPSGNQVVPCGRTDRQIDRHMTKAVITFVNFAIASEKEQVQKMLSNCHIVRPSD
jgi:hypothetical protein